MKIEYLKVKNFLCIGEDPLEIDFTKLDKIVLIKGQNLDFHDETEDALEFSSAEDEYHSNGAGKSTISEALVYGLYGSTIRKKVSHQDAINNKNKKKLEVEVIFRINDTRYRIVRCRKPDSLSLWQDGPPWDKHNEITKGGQPSTQKHIEENILRMNHKAFVNVVCFGQHNDYNFLECPAAEQRAIAESLLSLEVYKQYSATAKDELKATKTDLKDRLRDYERTTAAKATCEIRIKQIKSQEKYWKEECATSIGGLKSQLTSLQKELDESDIGPALAEYEKAQDHIESLKTVVSNTQAKQTEIENAVEAVQQKQNQVSIRRHDLTLEFKSTEKELHDNKKAIQKHQDEIGNLKSLKTGAKCPACHGPIDPKHYKHIVTLNQNKIEHLQQRNKLLESKLVHRKNEVAKYTNSLGELQALGKSATEKRDLLRDQLTQSRATIQKLSKIQSPDLNARSLVLKEKISQTETLLAEKEQAMSQGGPYVEILNTSTAELEKATLECSEQKVKIAEVEDQIPYYEYWVKAFGDEGIRSFIIEGITPALNARVAYWLHYLINNKLTVRFDKHLDATIEANPPTGDPFAYFATCGGERKRINLAISQSFAHVMMLSSGTWPSLVFLDEVSDSIDRRGIKSIYQMICELSAEKQVFVITHNIHLREMLEGVDTIVVERKDGCTKRVA